MESQDEDFPYYPIDSEFTESIGLDHFNSVYSLWSNRAEVFKLARMLREAEQRGVDL